MRADVALTFMASGDASAALASVASAINSHFGVNLATVFDSFRIVLQKTAMGYQVTDTDATGTATTNFHITSYYTLGFKFTINALLFWVTFNGSGVNFTILQNPLSTAKADFFGISGLSSKDCRFQTLTA